jgi:hypothetical protein
MFSSGFIRDWMGGILEYRNEEGAMAHFRIFGGLYLF